MIVCFLLLNSDNNNNVVSSPFAYSTTSRPSFLLIMIINYCVIENHVIKSEKESKRSKPDLEIGIIPLNIEFSIFKVNLFEIDDRK